MIERITLPVSAASYKRMMKVEKLRAALAVAQERFDAAITAAAQAELRTLEESEAKAPSRSVAAIGKAPHGSTKKLSSTHARPRKRLKRLRSSR